LVALPVALGALCRSPNGRFLEGMSWPNVSAMASTNP
jgi:hypothetical protein